MVLTLTHLSEKPIHVRLALFPNPPFRTCGWVTYEMLDVETMEKRVLKARLGVDKPHLVSRWISWHTHRRIVRQFADQGIEPIEFCFESPNQKFHYGLNYKNRFKEE